MMVMAFQSSPIFSLPRARLECSVVRFMRPLGVLRASYYHGGVRREATEPRGAGNFGATPKSSSNASSLCRHVLAEPTGIITISQIHHDSGVRVLNAQPGSRSARAPLRPVIRPISPDRGVGAEAAHAHHAAIVGAHISRHDPQAPSGARRSTSRVLRLRRIAGSGQRKSPAVRRGIELALRDASSPFNSSTNRSRYPEG